MGKEQQNKAIVGRWFTEFWGKNVNLAVIDEIAAPNMLLRYSLHEPRREHLLAAIDSLGKIASGQRKAGLAKEVAPFGIKKQLGERMRISTL